MEAKVERISILQSSIKTRIGNDIHQRPAKISILQSSIKTKTKKAGNLSPLVFQFYKVRLKLRKGLEAEAAGYDFNSTKFD